MAVTMSMDEYRRFLANYPKIAEKSMKEGLWIVAKRLNTEYRNQIKRNQPFPAYATGALWTSVRPGITGKYVYVRAFSPYAVEINNGARPFLAPLDELIRWAAVIHAGGPSFARAVQKKIATRGIAPRHFREKAEAIVLNSSSYIRRQITARMNANLRGSGSRLRISGGIYRVVGGQ